MAALLAAILLLASPGARSIEPETDESDTCVILLHGLGRTPLSMVPLQIALELAGYRTVNQGYPSRGESIEALAAAHVAEALTKCASPPDVPVHFVAHSLGGHIGPPVSARPGSSGGQPHGNAWSAQPGQ